MDWIGNAVDVPQYEYCEIEAPWVGGDTATFTINGKDLVITMGAATTTGAAVAALIVEAWNSTERINSTAGSSNVGGASIPEFAEIVAEAHAAGVLDTAVTVSWTTRNSREYGKPFTITDSDTCSGGGTVDARTVIQAATGKNHWNNPDNWSTGSVPTNNDVVNFRDSDVDCIYGLPSGALEVTINVYNTFTGRLGLPKINRDNQRSSYYEYRPRYVVLNDAGSGSAIVHTIGIGDGKGPGLVNIHQTVLPATFEVEVNSRPNEGVNGEGTRVVNVICPVAGATINVRKGTVDASDQNGATAKVTAITISGKEGNVSDIDVLSIGNASTACTVIQVGGKLTIDWATWSTNGLTLRGGTTVVDTCGIPSAQVSNGTLVDMGNGTIAALTLNRAGCLDVSPGASTITITNANYHAGCKVINPGKRITHTNAIATFGLISEVAGQLDYGYNRTLQIAG